MMIYNWDHEKYNEGIDEYSVKQWQINCMLSDQNGTYIYIW